MSLGVWRVYLGSCVTRMIAYLQNLLENHSQVQIPPWPAPNESVA